MSAGRRFISFTIYTRGNTSRCMGLGIEIFSVIADGGSVLLELIKYLKLHMKFQLYMGDVSPVKASERY